MSGKDHTSISDPILAGSPREGRASSTEARPEHHVVAGHDRLTVAKPQHDFRDHLPNEPGALVISAIIGGVRGAIVARFIDFRNLHNGPISGKDAQDNAA